MAGDDRYEEAITVMSTLMPTEGEGRLTADLGVSLASWFTLILYKN